MEDFFRAKEISFTPVTIDNLDELMAVYQAGKCGSYTADRSRHYAVGLQLANPYDDLILPGVILKEPLEPAVRHGDEQWFNIVRWTLYALIKAEELKVTVSSVDDLKTGAKNPAIRRLLGAAGKFGTDMGLDAVWAVRAIKAAGNYAEIFDRNLGKGSRLGIEWHQWAVECRCTAPCAAGPLKRSRWYDHSLLLLVVGRETHFLIEAECCRAVERRGLDDELSGLSFPGSADGFTEKPFA